MKNIFYEILLRNQIKDIVFENFLTFEIFQLSQNYRTKISFENRCSKKGTPLHTCFVFLCFLLFYKWLWTMIMDYGPQTFYLIIYIQYDEVKCLWETVHNHLWNNKWLWTFFTNVLPVHYHYWYPRNVKKHTTFMM
jgi:hypothetical protein